jgi:hypothetical protein
MIQRSRGGGSINPAVMDEMKKYIAMGKLEICEDLEIWSADWSVSFFGRFGFFDLVEIQSAYFACVISNNMKKYIIIH